MYFREVDLADLREGLTSIRGKSEELMLKYTTRNYTNNKAAEFGRQGFLRRVQTLERCIENVFVLLPPEMDEPPSRDVRHDAEISIQAFILSVFGSLDNLAWLSVIEKAITNPNGSPLKFSKIGIGPDDKIVLSAFSPEFRDYLIGLRPWFNNLKNFRDSLAHRIPLYIPPFIILNKDESTYRELERQISGATLPRDLEKVDGLTAELNKLKKFIPVMQHSFIEESRQVVFHSQLIADFNTVHELGIKMFDELNG